MDIDDPLRRDGQEPLQTLVNRAGVRLKLASLLYGVHWWLAACLALWLVLFALDSLLNLPASLRLPLALGGAAFSLGALLKKIWIPAARRQTPERTAIQLENQYQIPDNLLINAVQFQRQPLRPEEQPFADRTVRRSSQLAAQVRLADLWNWDRLGLCIFVAWTVVILGTLYLALLPRHFLQAGKRYLWPLGDVPPLGEIVLRLTPDSEVTLAEGEPLEVSVRMEGPLARIRNHTPVILWQENTAVVPPSAAVGQPIPMAGQPDSPATYRHTFHAVHTPFAFRVFAGESYTRSVRVRVRPLPRLAGSVFRLTPPAYTGLGPVTNPGPPATVACLPGSRLALSVTIEPKVRSVAWLAHNQTQALTRAGSAWEGSLVVTASGPYEIQIAAPGAITLLPVSQGNLELLADNPPQIDFVTADRNRLVQFGQTFTLELQARDDYGLQQIDVRVRPLDGQSPGTSLKLWNYLGPPGPPGPLKERFTLDIAPRYFNAGATYVLEAVAGDFCPNNMPTVSRPILLRVRSQDELTLEPGDPLSTALASLKQTIAKQQQANHVTANLLAYLVEALAQNRLLEHRDTMARQQEAAQDSGRKTVTEFQRHKEGRGFVAPLVTLVETGMSQVLQGIRVLSAQPAPRVQTNLVAIEKRQAWILSELLALVGRVTDRGIEPPSAPPAELKEEVAQELHDQVQEFVAAEEKVIERSKPLLEKGPQDLTSGEEQILGELAREEAKWAKFFEEKLTDFSKLPLQDFADSSLAQEFNQVFQEIQAAEQALTQKNIELAVPHEQSGLENARELLHNLERWLPDNPDNLKWTMEEPLAPADIALAELPAEMEDIVGKLLDQEESMAPEVEDVTSSWLDSLDKGAGWDAMDGPISSLSAKGVTGNRLPNQMEIGGRAGEGRTGRSHGQMASDSAEGKGGRETPTRLTPSPFEAGSVKDAAKDTKGGATGGGKLAGFGPEGLRGPAPDSPLRAMPRLADQQAKIRQEAETLALSLRRYHLPTGDLESSVSHMKNLETSARQKDGLGVRQAYGRAIDALGSARSHLESEAGLRREQIRLPSWYRDAVQTGLREGIPKGYEEMTSAYFKALATSDHR